MQVMQELKEAIRIKEMTVELLESNIDLASRLSHSTTIHRHIYYCVPIGFVDIF